MKINIFYLLIFIIPLGTLGQTKSDDFPITNPNYSQYSLNRSYPQIKGRVVNWSANDLQDILIKYSLVNIGNPMQSSYNIKLDQDGSFLITLPDKLPNRQIWFTFGDYVYTCLYSDEYLEITFDLDKLKKKPVYMTGDGLKFGGKDGDKNRIMNEYILFNKRYNENFSGKISLLATEDNDYIAKLDSLFAFQQQINKKFYTEFSNTYQTLIDGKTKSSYYAKKLNYLFRNSIQVDTISELLTPVYSISNDSHEYFQFLNYYMQGVGFKKTKKKFSFINLALYYDEVLPSIYADLLKIQFEDRDIKEQCKLYEQLRPTLHTDWTKDYLDSQIKALARKITQIDSISAASAIIQPKNSTLGKLIIKTGSGSSLYIDQHKSGEDLLKTLKAVFADKLVIIDLWATWCIPCIQAMPSSKKLHAESQVAELPIEFVYLCTSSGSNEQKWQNKVLELNQPGTHIFVDSKVLTEIMNIFDKGGFPSYILLTPSGQYDYKSISSIQELSLDLLKQKLL
ncbi:thioredoxin-like domain-containing protein [Sphingobacterium siyangense]|uniref:TlpA family protein disulfide reductase n=1 Tax=Sphingobacterium siyangense TaxID=459529 RepID=UPI002FD9442B